MNSPIRISFFLLFCGVLPTLVAADDPGPRGGVRVVGAAPEAGGRESVDERVERLLLARIDIGYKGSLGGGLAAIGRAVGVEIVVDMQSAEEGGGDLTEEVHWDVRNCTADDALDYCLRDYGLEWRAVDGRLCCFDENSKRLLTRETLDTGELLQATGSPRYREEFLERFPEFVTTIIQPTQWEVVNGPCRLDRPARLRDGRFLLTATPSVRREITTLIRTMVDATKAESPVSMAPILTENAAAMKAVEQPVTLDVVDAPLREVLPEIGRQIGMPITLDLRSLEEMGVATDEPVTVHCRNLRVSDALARICRDLELTWHCLGGGLMVTHQETAMNRLSTAVFDVHDLLMFVDGTPDLDSLFDLITMTIQPTTWDSVGGPGSLEAIRLEKHTFLIVSHTQEMLLEIKSLLDRARRAKKEYHPVLRHRHEEWAALAKALDKRVRWHFDEVPLDEAMATVSATLGVDVYLDRRSLEEMGIWNDLTLSAYSLPAGEYVARDALARMLRPHESTCLVSHGGLTITHCETAMNRLDTVLFDVTDLVLFGEPDSRRTAHPVEISGGTTYVQFGGPPPRVLPWTGDFYGLDAYYDFDSLIDCVQTIVSPTTWDSVGGPGSMKGMDADERALLVVRQTQEELDRVTSLFEALRDIRKGKAKAKAVVLESNTDAAVRKALDKRVAWSFNETSLSHAVVKIAADLGVDVVTDSTAFEEMGLDPNTIRLSLPFLYFDAHEALRRSLEPHNLSFMIRNGTLVITTEDTAHAHLREAIFNITDLLASGKATEDGLVEAIEQTVQPETWDSVGGPGAIKTFEIPGGQTVLAVSQTDEVLHEVERRLEKLRKQ